MENIIKSYPAVDIIEPPKDSDGIATFQPDDIVTIDHLSAYRFGDVWSAAKHWGDDPAETEARARKHGHKLVWLNGEGASLTAHKRAKEQRYQVQMGQTVRYCGSLYTIVPEPNKNLGLKPAE